MNKTREKKIRNGHRCGPEREGCWSQVQRDRVRGGGGGGRGGRGAGNGIGRAGDDDVEGAEKSDLSRP